VTMKTAHSLRPAWMAFQIGCTYIGTVVGAGFASGQEIYQFFGRYGNHAYLSILLSVFLFAWVGYRLMLLGQRLNAESFQEVNLHLFGPWFGRTVNGILVVMLFGLTVAMVAGAGELLHEQFHYSFQFGALLTIAITYLTVLRGMRGLLDANSLIAPIMVGFILYAGIHAFSLRGVHAIQVGQTIGVHGSLMPVVSSILYVSFNAGLASGVLIPLGASARDKRTLTRGAMIGAGGLGLMMTAILFILFTYYPDVVQYQVPMGHVARLMGTLIQWMFILVLWGEIYSTLVGNVFALTTRSPSRSKNGKRWFTAALLLLAFAVSHFGFSNIVHYVYPVFGWMSVLLVLGLIWPPKL
jgi:uncharacterized membrane protein YkvI